MTQEPPIDLGLLAQLWPKGAEEALGALNEFRQHNDRDAARLRDAFQERSAARILEVCHRIIGSGWTVGATALTSACEEIETRARNNDWDGVATALEAFEREVARLGAYIESRGRLA